LGLITGWGSGWRLKGPIAQEGRSAAAESAEGSVEGCDVLCACSDDAKRLKMIVAAASFEIALILKSAPC
jgi:hypothetical protein